MKFPIWFSAGLIAASVTTGSTTPENASHQLTPAEEWVVGKVTAGEFADLSNRFPEEKDRKLSAHFLEDLLTGTLPGIKLHRHGVRIKTAIIDEPIDLRNAQIPCEVDLVNCQFMSSVTLNRTRFASVVVFDGSEFKANAIFTSMKVGDNISFPKVVFEGPVEFRGIDIASNFQAQGAKFQNKEQGANFNSMKVGHSAFFDKAVFAGPVNFVSADIASFFGATEAQFQNKEKGAVFSGMKVGDRAVFNKAVFEGPVNFSLANIAANFEAQGSKCQSKEKGAMFTGIKVGGALFQNAVFEGPVNFSLANIAANFAAQGAKFQNEQEEAGFNSVKVGHSAFFDKAVFAGPVNFISADIASEFRAQEAKFENKEKGAKFTGMKVGYSAFFDKAVFAGPANFAIADIANEFHATEAQFQNKQPGINFEDVKVGSANFKKAVFEGPVDLRGAAIGALHVPEVVWPKDVGAVHLQAMRYKFIRAATSDHESHDKLLQLADQSAYTADVYSNLEEFFLRQGYRGDADRAFIAGKRRERKENLHGLGWLGSCLLDWLVGYGRRPWQAGIPCAVLVALGCVLFSPKKMEPQRPEDTPRVYSRFWYSLGLFLPFVDLQADKVWKPKADQTFLRNYMRVHVLLGWILIPIVLAALTGLIK